MTARRSKLIKESGPYKVESCADGTLIITTNQVRLHRWEQDPNAPGVVTRMQLAREIEELLNVGTTQ